MKMNTTRDKRVNAGKIVAAFLVPVALLLVIYAVWGQYPFGNKTLLIWDMNWQYSAFFSTLHDILHGDTSAWYSFSRALGGDMVGVFAYYLISPFNLIFFFFDTENIYIGILLLVLLKVGTMGVSMHCYLKKRHAGGETILFSTAYALCAYVIGYFFNIMWLDAMIFLPLVAWGIEKLVDENKSSLYIFALAGTIVTNFYIGFIVCVFAVIYFWAEAFFLSERKVRAKTILQFAVASIVSGMLTAGITLPTLYAIQGRTERIDIPSLFQFVWNWDIRWLFSLNFAGTMQSRQMILGQPLLYSGVLIFLLVAFYFVGTRGNLRKKCGYLLLLGIVAISFGFENLCRIWQAFNYTNGSPYRFSFVYCFLVITLGYEVFCCNLDEVTKEKKKKNSWILLGIVVCIGIVICRNYFLGSLQQETPWLNCVLVLLYVGIIITITNKRVRNCLLFGILCGELFLNAEFLYQYGEHYASVTKEEYQAYVEQMQPLVNNMEEESMFSKVVFTGDAVWSVNDPFLWGVNGLDSYTSVEKKATQESAKCLGYCADESFGVHYKTGSTMAAESLLGVTSLITSKEVQTCGYEQIKTSFDLTLYKNLYAFPMAWFADEKIADVKYLDGTYDYQNQIFRTVGAQAGDIFAPVTGIVTSAEGAVSEENESYKRAKDKELGYVIYQLQIEDTQALYYDPTCWGDALVSVWKNGKEIDLSQQTESPVKRLGIITPEDDISVQAILVEDAVFSLQNTGVYAEREENLAACASAVQNQNVEILAASQADIKIKCETQEEQYLVCMIPYDKQWHITLDGENTEAISVMGNFMALKLDEGEHEIRLRFIPDGGVAGIVLTILAMLIFFHIDKVFAKCYTSKSGTKSL